MFWRKTGNKKNDITYITLSHLADTFIQSDLQMRKMEAIKINKRAKIYASAITSLG